MTKAEHSDIWLSVVSWSPLLLGFSAQTVLAGGGEGGGRWQALASEKEVVLPGVASFVCVVFPRVFPRRQTAVATRRAWTVWVALGPGGWSNIYSDRPGLCHRPSTDWRLQNVNAKSLVPCGSPQPFRPVVTWGLGSDVHCGTFTSPRHTHTLTHTHTYLSKPFLNMSHSVTRATSCRYLTSNPSRISRYNG